MTDPILLPSINIAGDEFYARDIPLHETIEILQQHNPGDKSKTFGLELNKNTVELLAQLGFGIGCDFYYGGQHRGRRRNFTGKERDAETGLYYYGARRMNERITYTLC